MSRMADYVDDILIESMHRDFGYDYDQCYEILNEIRWRIADAKESYDYSEEWHPFSQIVDEIITEYLDEDYLQYSWIFTDN